MADESMAVESAAEVVFDSYLVLYVAVHKEDRAEVDRLQMLSIRRVTPKENYIGLRQDPKAAVERYCQAWSPTPESDLNILEVQFSEAGVAFFATNYVSKHGHAPLLYNKFWPNEKAGTPDWGCWRYLGDISLVGDELMQCRWL